MVAGVPFTVTVEVVDRQGRTVTGYRGTVRFSTSDDLVRSLPGAYTFTAADAGSHTFTGVTLVEDGRQRLRVDARRGPGRDSDRIRVLDAGAAVTGQVLAAFDPVEGAVVTVYDAVTGLVLATGPADRNGYEYLITGLPAGGVKLGAEVPGGAYLPDFANDVDTLDAAAVFVLQPATTLVQSWEPVTFGPYLDVQPVC
ncbi:hypothetical protein [Cellulomonas endophytica]|uniref:hypothetical protein n=1 Tax=Cellulomonas endophytica TaxID=2494735 RepID=UPI001010E848|nr:hypothetical protein [Cellulomonas endophytica]